MQLTDYSLSVVVSVYNVEPYLVACLESLLANEGSISEIICVNDGSTDQSELILRFYSELNSKFVVLQQENKGLSEARNLGLNHARGEYVMFVDGDDTIVTHSLAGVTGFAWRNGLDYLAFGIEPYQERASVAERAPIEEFAMTATLYDSGLDFLAARVAKGEFSPVVPPALYRRQFLSDSKLIFVPGILHEDNIFTFQTLLSAKRVAWLDRIIYQYRARADSITTMPKRAEHVKGLVSCRLLADQMTRKSFRARPSQSRLTHRLAIRYVKNNLDLQAQEAYLQASDHERQRFDSWFSESSRWRGGSRFRAFRCLMKPSTGLLCRQSFRALGRIIRILIFATGQRGTLIENSGRTIL